MKYQVCRDLTPIEYEALRNDIAENGVLVPVEVDENGEILDGHNRVRAWKEITSAGVNLPDYPRMIRTGMTEEQKRNHARKLNVLRRHMSKEEREEIMVAMRNDGMSYRKIAEAVGVDPMTAHKVVKKSGVENSTPAIAGADGKRYPAKQKKKTSTTKQSGLFAASQKQVDAVMNVLEKAPDIAEKMLAGEVSIDNAQSTLRNAERRQKRVDKIVEIAEGNKELAGTSLYSVIYADPPWRYEHSMTDNRVIENHYPTMSLPEICQLPVSELATPDSVLFLWATSPKLAEAMQVICAWGFVYRSCIVWDKERIGMGYYARQQHELLLIATKGELPVPEPANRPASVQRIKRDNAHSVKPVEFYGIIESMYPEYEKIELFSRSIREGWAAWGNQAC